MRGTGWALLVAAALVSGAGAADRNVRANLGWHAGLSLSQGGNTSPSTPAFDDTDASDALGLGAVVASAVQSFVDSRYAVILTGSARPSLTLGRKPEFSLSFDAPAKAYLAINGSEASTIGRFGDVRGQWGVRTLAHLDRRTALDLRLGGSRIFGTGDPNLTGTGVDGWGAGATVHYTTLGAGGRLWPRATLAVSRDWHVDHFRAKTRYELMGHYWFPLAAAQTSRFRLTGGVGRDEYAHGRRLPGEESGYFAEFEFVNALLKRHGIGEYGVRGVFSRGPQKHLGFSLALEIGG